MAYDAGQPTCVSSCALACEDGQRPFTREIPLSRSAAIGIAFARGGDKSRLRSIEGVP
jgi:hypothetical protein